MPKIAELDVGNLGIRPTEVGVEATAGAARRIGTFYNQTAAAQEQTGHVLGGALKSAGDAAVAIEDHREISTGAAKGVELFANLIDSKDQAIKAIDPNDPAYGQKVKAAVAQWQEQTVEPALEQFSQSFNTEKSQAWAEHFIDQTRTHMSREGISDVANAAKQGVLNAHTELLNQASNTVLQNPSSLDSMIDLYQHSVKGMVSSSAVKGTDAAAIQTGLTEKGVQKLVKDATLGAILQSDDPEGTAADYIKRYPKYINGDEALQLGRAAATQNRSLKRDEKAMMDWNHTEQTRDAALKIDKVFSDNVSFDDTGKANIKPGFFTDLNKAVAGNALAASGARTVAEWGRKQLEDKATSVSDPAVHQALLDRFTSNNPPTDIDILQAEAHGKLTTKDGSVMRELRKAIEERPIKSPIFNETMNGVKAAIGTDPIGKVKYTSFFQTFLPAYLALPPEQQAKALNMSDPTSLISQTMGKPGEPGSLRRTPLQMILDRKAQGLMDAGTAATAMAATGETIGGVKPNGGIVDVKSKDEASKLPKGTQFRREGDPNVYTRK